MTERDISCILSARWIPKVRKYVVKLGFRDERAEEVWMSEKQLAQIEAHFARTPKGYSSDRRRVIGCWNDRGYYAYAIFEQVSFIPPEQYDLNDLEDR